MQSEGKCHVGVFVFISLYNEAHEKWGPTTTACLFLQHIWTL